MKVMETSSFPAKVTPLNETSAQDVKTLARGVSGSGSGGGGGGGGNGGGANLGGVVGSGDGGGEGMGGGQEGGEGGERGRGTSPNAPAAAAKYSAARGEGEETDEQEGGQQEKRRPLKKSIKVSGTGCDVRQCPPRCLPSSLPWFGHRCLPPERCPANHVASLHSASEQGFFTYRTRAHTRRTEGSPVPDHSLTLTTLTHSAHTGEVLFQGARN